MFIALIILSAVTAAFGGHTDAFNASVLTSAGEAIQFIITGGSAIIVFSGITNIAKESGLCDILSGLLRPAVRAVLGELDADTQNAVAMNVTCNFLGLGNAATPYGISAIKRMKHGEKATGAMIRFVVLNTSSIQLLPTTVAALRQSLGSVSPFDILPCVWICSIISVASALFACFVCEKGGAVFAKLCNTCAYRADSTVWFNKKSKRV